MQDITINGNKLKTELLLLLASFLIANVINIYAIITYETPWSELWTSLGFVFMIMLCLYAITWLVRLLAKPIKKLI